MSDTPWTLTEGDVVAGRYVIVREIGRGGMGCVFESLDQRLERPVALKFLDPSLCRKADAVSRFQREALAAGRIGHESICDVRDRGETASGMPFIVMELLEGESLEQVLQREKTVEPTRMARLVLQTLSALTAAHKAGIVHRDLKPDNLFVTRDVLGLERIKILDFGISKFLLEPDRKRLTRTGTIVGTPLYMSPEQASGEQDIDHRTDIWSTGVIFYEALSGAPPFDGHNYNGIIASIIVNDPVALKLSVPELDDDLESVVLKALAKDREERYQSADECAAALRKAIAINEEDPLGNQLLSAAAVPTTIKPTVSTDDAVTVSRAATEVATRNDAQGDSRRRLALPVALFVGLVVASIVIATLLATMSHPAEPPAAVNGPVAGEDEAQPHHVQVSHEGSVGTLSPENPAQRDEQVGHEHLRAEPSPEVEDAASPPPEAGVTDDQPSKLTKTGEPERQRATKRDRPRTVKIGRHQRGKIRTDDERAPPNAESETPHVRVIRGKHGSALVADYPEEQEK